MKSWQDQADKNGLKILTHGSCQLCGSSTKDGISECVTIASLINQKVDHKISVDKMTLFLSVDAHALQHPEIHGRWNNHFHLSRLNLILNKKVRWSYNLSPLLSTVLDTYKLEHQNELIIPSPPLQRGKTTVTDVEGSQSEDDYSEIVYLWALQVYESYKSGRSIAEKVSTLFLEKLKTI